MKNQAGTRKKSKAPIVILIIAFILAVLVSVGYFTLKHFEKKFSDVVNVEQFYNGIVVQGVELGGKTKEQATAEIAAIEPTLKGNVAINLTYGDKTYTVTQNELKYTYNSAEVLDRAYQTARVGKLKARYDEVQSLATAPAEYPITCTLDETSVKEAVAKIAAQLNCAPVEAAVTGFNPNSSPMFAATEGVDGLTVDEAATAAGLLNLIRTQPQSTMEIVATPIPHTVTTQQVMANTQLISSFSTVSTNGAAGNANMVIALASFNGVIVKPGEIFSFNGSTGDSTTAEGGWQEAGAISQGKSVNEYGGGICQASTTLYGAVLRADLEVVERSNHRWPSAYVPIGQDASVDYGNLDFQFKNDKDSPIFLAAWMDATTLNIQIYGKKPADWDTIDVVSEQTGTIPADESITEEDSSLATGTQEVETTSRAGSEAEGRKIFYKDGAQVKTEEIDSSYYAPVQGVTKIGVG